jgi:hypothetical protein
MVRVQRPGREATRSSHGAPMPKVHRQFRASSLLVAFAVLLAVVASSASGSVGMNRVARQPSPVAGAAAASGARLLGDGTIERNRDSLIAGRSEAFAFRAKRVGVTATMHVYLDARSTARVLRVGIYRSRHGHPSALLAVGVTRSPRAGAWNVVPITAAKIVAKATYWLAVLGRRGRLRYRDRSHGSCKAEISAARRRPRLTTVWHAGRVRSTCPISAYVSAAPARLVVLPFTSKLEVPVLANPAKTSAPSFPPSPGESPTPPQQAPTSVSAPVITGVATEGRRLVTTDGTWTGSPTSYTYQWDSCDASGKSCTEISGATASSYVLKASDVGHAIKVIVTASNPGGSASQASAPTALVAARPPSCTTTLAAGTSATVIADTIASAADGSTICLANGSYPSIHVIDAAHSSYVTIRPAPEATATIAGMEVRDSSFLRFQELTMTEGFNMRDTASYPGSHDYQFIENRFEEPLYGIVLYGGSGPVRKVLIEGNYMHGVHLEKPEVAGKCSAGYAQGQDVTMYYAEGVTIALNTFKEAAWHYLQGGSAGPEGVQVEDNLFEGHVMMACSHLNLWQIWDGGENDTFSGNVAIGEGAGDRAAATDGLIFENGAASSECATGMTNTVIENNLFVHAASSYEIQVYTTHGLNVKNNTVVGSEYGTLLGTEFCGPGSDYDVTHNINVENYGTTPDFSFGDCTGTCVFDYNVSDDTSARQAGATHYVINWIPNWTTTDWNPASEAAPPAGYYLPSGLPIEAGYTGGGGP